MRGTVLGETMFKTFSDFVELASQRYCLPFEIAEKIIDTKLKEQSLGRNAVICYINWAGIAHLTQKQIAEKLNITQQVVSEHLNKLKAVWPHLFVFGPKVPPFNHRRSSHGRTMGRLRKNVSTKAYKF